MKKILITGGAGFIGSEFTRQAIKKGYQILVIDKLTYAGDLNRLKEFKDDFIFYKLDICAKDKIESVFKEEKPQFIVHFAAESHVDRSIQGSAAFMHTNLIGTQVLLDAARKINIEKFIFISTDEVYGEIKQGQFFEQAAFNPSSPYSASKAAADLLVRAYMRTFQFPAVILRASNNYGPWQYPEKFIPVVIYKAIKNQKIPVYARGLNIREWLFVSDCCAAILKVLEKSKIGKIYNIGSGDERKNIDVTKKALNILRRLYPLIEFVEDRPGHDYRYSLNCEKIREELGWEAKIDFENGLRETISWYSNNLNWLEKKVNFLKNYWKQVYKVNNT